MQFVRITNIRDENCHFFFIQLSVLDVDYMLRTIESTLDDIRCDPFSRDGGNNFFYVNGLSGSRTKTGAENKSFRTIEWNFLCFAKIKLRMIGKFFFFCCLRRANDKMEFRFLYISINVLRGSFHK